MTELAPRESKLVISPNQASFTEDQVLALMEMFGWDEIPRADLEIFFHQAKRTALDPFTRQIYLIGRKNNRKNRIDYTIQTSIDGMRLIADRTGRYAGSDRPIFGEDGKDRYAEVTVYKLVSGQRMPFTGVAYWSEFHQESSPMWKRMPRTMLAKCAEAQALRKAFPANLSGIYSAEEMDHAGHIALDPAQAQLAVSQPAGQVIDSPEYIEGGVLEVESSLDTKEHKAIVKKIQDMLQRFPESERPEETDVLDYARQDLQSARKALNRIQTLWENLDAKTEDEEPAGLITESQYDHSPAVGGGG